MNQWVLQKGQTVGCSKCPPCVSHLCKCCIKQTTQKGNETQDSIIYLIYVCIPEQVFQPTILGMRLSFDTEQSRGFTLFSCKLFTSDIMPRFYVTWVKIILSGILVQCQKSCILFQASAIWKIETYRGAGRHSA